MTSTITSISGSGTTKLPLKAIQPTQYWTFENALALINDCQDPYISEALDEYLLLIKDVILTPSPFSGDKSTSTTKIGKEVSLYGILYTDITQQNIKDGELVHKHLDLDFKEIIRVIDQVCKRVPPKPAPKLNFKSKLNDDRVAQLDTERIGLYIYNILRERRIVLKIARETLGNKTNPDTSSVIRNIGKELFLSKDYIEKLIKSLRGTLAYIINESYKTGLSKSIDEIIFNESVLFCIDSCKVLIEISAQNPLVTKDLVKQWFELMQETNFSVALGPNLQYSESFELIQTLFTVISIEFLDLDNAFDSLDDDIGSYVSDIDVFSFVNDVITSDYNSNAVIIYSWSVILLRKSYFYQEFSTPSIAKSFETKFPVPILDNLVNQCNSKSLALNVFGSLKELSEKVKFDKLHSTVLSSVITASISLVELTPEITDCIVNIIRNCPNIVVEKFFNNQATIEALIIARAKFPLLLSPYIKLASINGDFALHEFNDMKSYIQVYKRDQFDKLYQIDDQNPELVKLTDGVNLFPPFESKKKLAMALTIGTRAKMLPAVNPDEVLVTFLHEYNGWAFVGRVLYNISKGVISIDEAREELILDILRLMASVSADCGEDEIKLMLESMSAYIDDSDVIEIVLRFLEQSLHARNIAISSTVLKLLSNLLPIIPKRIWSYLAKSSLFTRDGKEGLALTIFGAVEMVNGDFGFSLALVNFADALTRDCISYGTNVDKLREDMIYQFTSHSVFLFENFSHCHFACVYDRFQLGSSLLELFTTILKTTYGVEVGCKPEKKLTRVFSKGSQYLLNCFLATDTNYTRTISPLINVIESCAYNIDLFELTDTSGVFFDKWISRAFSFAELVITLRNNLKLTPSALEKTLFEKASNLVATFANNGSYRLISVNLLTSLIGSKWENEPTPSLLSHLGHYDAQVLKQSIISSLKNSLDDYDLKIALNEFICAVMGSRQEGLIVLFNTGKSAFPGTQSANDSSNKDSEASNESVVQILKKSVREMKYYPNFVSLHLIDAIALSCNSWTIVKETKFDEEFINILIDRVKTQITDPPKSIGNFIDRCYELVLVAKIADILALYLFTTKNEKCRNQIIEFINSESFLEIAKHKFEIKHYQHSLHDELETSFKNSYPNLELAKFTNSLTKPNTIGFNSIYNLVFMDKLFHNHASWLDIKEQLIASSVNSQYLMAQFTAAKSFGTLLTSFCRRYQGPFNPELLKLVDFLLKTDVTENIPSAEFRQIYFDRIELGFYIVYSFFNAEKQIKHDDSIFEIIKSASTLLSSSSLNFITDLVASKGTYRPLLRIIYCALKMIKGNSKTVTGNLSLFQDLFDAIITKGIKSLSAELQNDVYLLKRSNDKSLAMYKFGEKFDDFQLILSILKVFIAFKPDEPLLTQGIASSVKQAGIVKTLLNVYTMSYSIDIGDEFAFAQMSLSYLLELMAIDSVAQSIVSSGLYVTLLESPISRPIRAGGLSVLNEAKYYRLWIDGILPIIIASISKLGASIVPEICVALQLFSKQIEHCVNSWARDSSSLKISSGAVYETNQILVIYNLLKAMNVGDYLNSTMSDYTNQAHFDDSIAEEEDASAVIDMRILPGLDSESNRDDFIDCIDNLLKHPKFLTSRIIASSPEEKSIIDRGGEWYDVFVKSIFEDIREMKNMLS
ncbi:Nup188 nuclear pore complex subunit [Candida orthopsilosis Co 90-125]|uniref:Nucleoporin NUP188 n=1 Tax=Candida orthopsilosis (strain 90-125) TaxID=1136231 RepID=H8WWB8_CANO9|nr:Nup188 nuclear pore complex subunit [Candida orthopsilosis Co 90-125]CCG20742.1 Nup188 nuclear pore complex subunit [Candida orthopsilosis Co 90-125]